MAQKKAESRKQKAGKNAKKGAGVPGIAVANHPKARQQINMLKSWAGLGAFCLAGYFAWKGGAVFTDVATRALLWGIATYVSVWAMAVQVWRQVAIAQVRAAERQWRESKQAEKDQVEKLRKALEDNGLPTEGAGAMPVS
jgi:hypothetical protein